MWFGYNCSEDHFLSRFLHSELSHFSPFIYKQLVSIVSATPLNSFAPVIMKLCVHFLHGMRMCMWLGCNWYSLREIIPTDAGQLSDGLKFLAG